MAHTGILIGRFQTAEISGSLKQLISDLVRDHDQFAIVLGATSSGATRKNPISVDLRKEMIVAAFPLVQAFKLDDHPSDEQWSSALDKLVREKFGDENVTLYGSEDNLIERYHGKYKVSPKGKSYAPYKQKDAPAYSSDLSAGIIYGLQQTYPKVYPTVDIAVFRNKRTQVLLGAKALEKKWRFPGGFVDPSDENYESASLRELQEECGLTEVTTPVYESSFRVDDWRYRREDDKIVTILFSSDHVSGDAVASDDLQEVRWFDLEIVKKLITDGETAAEHRPLFEFIIGKYRAG